MLDDLLDELADDSDHEAIKKNKSKCGSGHGVNYV